MRVDQIMTRNVRSCTPADTLNDAARIMWEEDCGCVPVVVTGNGSDARLTGMLTDRDVCMAAYTQGRPLEAITVGSAMSRDVRSCRGTDTLAVALKVLRTNQLHRLPVVDADERLIGILAIADLAREAARQRTRWMKDVSIDEIGTVVAAISEPRSGPGALATVA